MFFSANTFNSDVIESEVKPSIRMEKLDRSVGAVKRNKKRRKRQENSSGAFILVPGGVNALLPLFLPQYTKSSSRRPPIANTGLSKEKLK